MNWHLFTDVAYSIVGLAILVGVALQDGAILLSCLAAGILLLPFYWYSRRQGYGDTD